MEIDHIGYIVRDIKKSLLIFNKLGFIAENNIIYDSDRSIEILFIRNKEILIELVSPSDDKTSIYKLLNKNGCMPYHICYKTNNLGNSIVELKKERFKLLQNISNAIAFNNRKIAFLYNPDYGILELLEDQFPERI